MIATAEERFGRLDILVNNAGFGAAECCRSTRQSSEDLKDRIHAVNIRGVFLGMKYGVISML